MLLDNLAGRDGTADDTSLGPLASVFQSGPFSGGFRLSRVAFVLADGTGTCAAAPCSFTATLYLAGGGGTPATPVRSETFTQAVTAGFESYYFTLGCPWTLVPSTRYALGLSTAPGALPLQWAYGAGNGTSASEFAFTGRASTDMDSHAWVPDAGAYYQLALNPEMHPPPLPSPPPPSSAAAAGASPG